MLRSNLPFGKIASTTTQNSWSLSYSAGKFFLTVSLSLENEPNEAYLQTQGKQLINDLEAEFFTLNQISLSSIKTGLNQILDQIPKDLRVSLAVATVKNNVLYIFLFGPGSILIKRNDKIGTLLEQTDPENRDLKSASGLLQKNDLIFLQTDQMRSTIPMDKLIDALNTNDTEEIADILTPLVHNEEPNGQAAVFFIFMDSNEASPDEILVDEVETQHEQENKKENTYGLETESQLQNNEEIQNPVLLRKSKLNLYLKNLSPRKKILLTIAIFLCIALLGGIVFTKISSTNRNNKKIYNDAIKAAEKNLEEGTALIGLNSSLATEELIKAEGIYKDAKSKLTDSSKEEKMIDEMISKVEKLISDASGGTKSDTKESTENIPMLDLKASDKNVLYTAQDESGAYGLTKSKIYLKKGDSSEDLIGNEDYWEDGTGVSIYSGNIYVLDSKNGIIKFTKTNDGYAQSNYLKSSIDLSNARHIAIDSSIYVLFSDGSVLKFTRGEPDQFSLTGLDKPLNNPTRLYTFPEAQYIYILDPKNSRIVKTDKSGTLQKQYLSNQIKSASELFVDESKGKIYILVSNKTYEIDL